jgi:hypothetical protein
VVEIAELLKVVSGTIVEAALVVLVEMIAPADVAAESVPSMVTPLVGPLELPRIVLCTLGAAIVPLVLPAADWIAAVVVSLELESLVVLSESVLPTPGNAVIVDPELIAVPYPVVDPGVTRLVVLVPLIAPELTKLAVLDPVVELTPLSMPVVELGGAAVLESIVL